jgi:D-3-phosphoglycerate dehydrogenase
VKEVSKKVLVTAPYMQPVPEKYRNILEARGIELSVPDVEERFSEAELLDVIAGFDGVISGDDEFTEEVYKAATKLKVISKWGTGIDSLKADIAKRYNVTIRNTPNAFTVPVADTVLGYMLCFARKLPWMSAQIKAGEWDKIPGFSLSEKTLGIIGVGNIGRAVARRAAAFGMTIIGSDLLDMDRDFLKETGMEMLSTDDLLKRADFVSINCDLNETSHCIMDKVAFKLMKPTAFMINTARGPLVDEAALADALKAGELAGAALDVFEVEPLPENSLLRKFDNVMLAPHNSNSSPGAWERVHQSTVDNLLEELFKEEG